MVPISLNPAQIGLTAGIEQSLGLTAHPSGFAPYIEGVGAPACTGRAYARNNTHNFINLNGCNTFTDPALYVTESDPLL